MQTKITKYILLVTFYLCLSGLSSYALAVLIPEQDQSFAEQYEELAALLTEVKNKETALLLKADIQEQIVFLQMNQRSGGEAFNALSKEDQAIFVKRFQHNRYHCGGVTQVMQERRRILLNPELAYILRDLLNQIP